MFRKTVQHYYGNVKNMGELNNERSEFYDDPKAALERKIEAISKLANSESFILITLEPDGKGGFHVFYARQKMNQETTEKLMHDAAKKFHEFDEKEKEVKQMLEETVIERPEWLTDDVIADARKMFTGINQSVVYEFLLSVASKTNNSDYETIQKIFNQYIL